ncbi:MAG: carboxymuconolactone decarboxylase family protein [Pseudomonadota bacterium]
MSMQSGLGQQAMGDIAPKLADLTDEVLFGDVWQREGLSKRDRSLVTVAALVALNRSEQLPFHLGRALENGVSWDELVELITHLAFYSGWPTAATAVNVLKTLNVKAE